MRKYLGLILGLILIFSVNAFALDASDWVISSGDQTATAAITTTEGVFHGVMLFTDGTNPVTLNIHDNATAASGTNLIPSGYIVTTSASNRSHAISLMPPLRYYKGIYVSITCAGTVHYVVLFRPTK